MDCETIKKIIGKEHIICCEQCHDDHFKDNREGFGVVVNDKEYLVCCSVYGEWKRWDQ